MVQLRRVLVLSLVLARIAHADEDVPIVSAAGREGPGELAASIAEALAAQERRMQWVARHLASMQAQQQQLDQMYRRLLAWREPSFVPIAVIQPGQLRFASLNVRDKVERAVKSGDALARPCCGYLLKHDEGRSALPREAALPVILGPSGYVLVDGHHDVLASLELGARTVPVKVVADLSNLGDDAFWREADARGYVYPYQLGGAWQRPPRHFDQLTDDPLRYFAAVAARKCSGPDQPAAESSGPDAPLWIKVGKDIPYIEFKIADALFNGGLRYDNALGSAPPPELVERARGLLAERPVRGLRLIRERRVIAEMPGLCAMVASPP